MTIDCKQYNFEIDVRPIYIPIITGDKEELALVKVLDKPRYAVIRTDTNQVLDIVSDVWEGMNHAEVVDSVKQSIIPKLGWNIKDESLNMWMNGAIMFYSMKTEHEFIVNGTKLYATVNAVNSHNRYTKAGVHLTLMDELGTNYLPTVGSKSVYTYESMLHRKSTLDILLLQKLVDNIPVLIHNTVVSWQSWGAQRIEFPRVYVLAQLFNFRLGEYLVEKMPTGGTRFEMYKHICQFMLNKEKMSTSGFSSLTQMVKFVRIMKRDKLFDVSLDLLKTEILHSKIFDWDEKALQKEERKNKTAETQEENEVQVADIGENEVDTTQMENETQSQVESLLDQIL